MHDNPRATENEQEAAHEGGRQEEEEDMRYPSPGNRETDTEQEDREE